MTGRRWAPTGTSRRPGVDGTAASGWSTATRRRGLTPRSDAELRPVLLDLLASHAPVAQWPTQRRQPKRRRTARAREAAQTAAVARDRPGHGKNEGDGTPAQPLATNVVPIDRDGHARQIQDAIDAERRRRREQAVPVTPPPPPRLGETYRRSSLLILPPEDRDAEDLPAEATSAASEEARWR